MSPETTHDYVRQLRRIAEMGKELEALGAEVEIEVASLPARKITMTIWLGEPKEKPE